MFGYIKHIQPTTIYLDIMFGYIKHIQPTTIYIKIMATTETVLYSKRECMPPG